MIYNSAKVASLNISVLHNVIKIGCGIDECEYYDSSCHATAKTQTDSC